MKNWMSVAILIASGLLGAGVLYLVAAPPRGEPIKLLPPPTKAPLLVHVTGAVASPGVYEFPEGSRVRDAIEAAGGYLPEADTSNLNLAARISDGDQIIVGSLPTFSSTPGNSSAIIKGNQAESKNEISSDEKSESNTLININSAKREELETLPGIGPVLAQRIIDYRQNNGSFDTIDEITQVSGIGSATLEKLREHITVEP